MHAAIFLYRGQLLVILILIGAGLGDGAVLSDDVTSSSSIEELRQLKNSILALRASIARAAGGQRDEDDNEDEQEQTALRQQPKYEVEIEPKAAGGRAGLAQRKAEQRRLTSPAEQRPARRKHRARHRHDQRRRGPGRGRGQGRRRGAADFAARVKVRTEKSKSTSASRSPVPYCPKLLGKERLACPRLNKGSSRQTPTHCIYLHQLCDDRDDCPNGSDEDDALCLFYRTTMMHFKNVVDVVVSLTNTMTKIEEHNEHHREL